MGRVSRRLDHGCSMDVQHALERWRERTGGLRLELSSGCTIASQSRMSVATWRMNTELPLSGARTASHCSNIPSPAALDREEGSACLACATFSGLERRWRLGAALIVSQSRMSVPTL